MNSRIPTIPRVIATIIVAGAAVALPAAEKEKPTPIKPEEARKHVGTFVVVTMKVNSCKYAHRAEGTLVYLDSTENFRLEENLGIAISEKGLADLKNKKGVEHVTKHFFHKTIRVTGKIVMRHHRPYIDVHQAKQIDLVKKEKKEEKKEAR